MHVRCSGPGGGVEIEYNCKCDAACLREKN